MKTLILAFFVMTTAQTSLAEPPVKLPGEVKALIVRIQGCIHFSGEEPYDKARKAEIAKAMHKLRCESLDKNKVHMLKNMKINPTSSKPSNPKAAKI